MSSELRGQDDHSAIFSAPSKSAWKVDAATLMRSSPLQRTAKMLNGM
jgi:hypothetical protein